MASTPSPLAITRAVTIGAGESALVVTVHEITPRQVREWLVSMQSADMTTDLIRDMGKVGEPTISDISLMSDADPEKLEDIPDSALDELRRVAKELNPGFFDRKAVVSAAMQSIVRETLKTS